MFDYCVTIVNIVHCSLRNTNYTNVRIYNVFLFISIYFNLFLNFWFIVHCLLFTVFFYFVLNTLYFILYTLYFILYTLYFVLCLLFVYTLTPTIHISSICSCSPRHFSIVSSRICFCSSIALCWIESSRSLNCLYENFLFLSPPNWSA